MTRQYTCPSCRHSGCMTGADPGGDSAEPICAECGARVESIAVTNDPSVIDGPVAHNATVDWKRTEAPTPTVPGYTLLREIGRGGMGVVYKARENKLNRIVALKMILSGPYSSADQLARFQTEARSVAQLQHPHIVQIYEISEFDGHPFCAFEYMDGGSLGSKCFRNPLPSREAAQTVEALARAIHTAHQRGIVHRDLKPENILLNADGLAKISDFGLAKQMASETGQTQTGSILGTPTYMSPEQAAGKTRDVGPSADIWALGAILYYLLTGQPPFQGTTIVDTLEQVRNKEPVPPSRSRPKLPRDLETICLKCLQKEPRSRYGSAEALADDLRRFLANEPILARPVGMVELVVRHLRRRPATAALLGLLCVVMTLLAGSLVWLWRSESARLHAAHRNKPYDLTIPRGLRPLSIPADNPLTEARVDLGKQLFFDKRLSADNTVACATCHEPSKGWSNGKAVAEGIGGKLGSRKSPSIVNVAYQTFFFWDGRAGSLEEQALGPIQDHAEMGMPSLAELEARLNRVEGYRVQFQDAFKSDVTAANLARALAAYQRTILSGDAPVDRHKAGEAEALSEPARRGLALFVGKAHCSACHSGANFSDGAFHNVGIGTTSSSPDVGRERISGLLGDRSSFKTPSLRDVVRGAPYMHDGSLKSLEEVVEHYDRGGVPNPQLDEDVLPLKLTAREKRDLVAFLREGLTSSAYPFVSAPKLPD